MGGSKILKPKFVIFEGCDKVGKTTLFRKYRNVTHYIPLAIDRFTGSNYVYDRYYGRGVNLEAYLEAEEKIQEIFDCYLILLTAPTEILLDRIINEESEPAKTIALNNFQGIRGLFEDYFENWTRYKNKFAIDTWTFDIDSCLSMILDYTGELKR